MIGWNVKASGFEIVLTPGFADLIADHFPAVISGFLSTHGLTIADIGCWLAHPVAQKCSTRSRRRSASAETCSSSAGTPSPKWATCPPPPYCTCWRMSERNRVEQSGSCSATTIRDRRNEWIAARIFTRLEQIALDSYNTMIGLDLEDVAVERCIVKAPCGGEAAGRSQATRELLDEFGCAGQIVTKGEPAPLHYRASESSEFYADVKLKKVTGDSSVPGAR